jgi:hypothetical protein
VPREPGVNKAVDAENGITFINQTNFGAYDTNTY